MSKRGGRGGRGGGRGFGAGRTAADIVGNTMEELGMSSHELEAVRK